jgi:hypothetical protein
VARRLGGRREGTQAGEQNVPALMNLRGIVSRFASGPSTDVMTQLCAEMLAAGKASHAACLLPARLADRSGSDAELAFLTAHQTGGASGGHG